MPSTARVALAGALGLFFAATPAHAQSLDDDYWVRVSGFWAKVDTDLSVSSVANATTGSEIDLEEDLGFDDSEFLPSIYAGARLGSGFSIIAEYYSLDRDSMVSLARDIVFEDVTYPAAATVTSTFATDIYRLAVGWEFAREENFAIGGALGLHATNIEVGIEGQGSIGGAGLQIEQRREDFLAPLPTIGLFATFEPMPGLTLGARADYMSLSIDDYDGRLLNAEAWASYRFMRNVGVGLMWRHVDYRLDVEKERYVGRFDYQFSGPAIFLEAGF